MSDVPIITYEQLLDWLRLLDESLIEHRVELTELDSAIGDGDHGTNLARGAAAASAKVDAEKPEYIDELFRTVGMTLISSVGGASGPLYGTFFLRFSLTAGHRQQLTIGELSEALSAGCAGVVERSKAELGDKTMIDAMQPAVEMFAGSTGELGLKGSARAAAYAAERGRDSTADMVARKGRASYLGDRAIGHIDPGAASTALMFQALLAALD
jgi:dihydroxyacetone kinase-like protein